MALHCWANKIIKGENVKIEFYQQQIKTKI